MQKNTNKSKEIKEPRIINIFDRNRVEIVGAKEVVSSTEKEVYIKLSDGFMQILGLELVIVKLVPEEEFLLVSGQITGLNFVSKLTKKSLFGKVFKWDFSKIMKFYCLQSFCGLGLCLDCWLLLLNWLLKFLERMFML